MARWAGVSAEIERVRAKLKRTCGRCGHGFRSHDEPSPEQGVPHYPPRACHVKRGCMCILFVAADEWCKPEVRDALMRGLAVRVP